MKKKLPLLLLLLFLICILSISAISATENTANNDVIGADNNKENNLEINIQYDNVSTSKENCVLKLEQNNNDELKDSGELNFNDLNRIINGNSNSTIYLSSNYKYNEESDSELVNGVIIDRNLTIYGNGITLNGNKMARIFNVIDFNLNVSFYDIHFINGHSSNNGGAIRGGTAYNCNFDHNYAYDGGALCGGTAYNCTFKDNEAKHDGGAIFDGNAYYCTFTGNEAVTGGAMYDSNAYNCTFTENEADKGGAMYGGVAFNSTFTKNEADKGGAMYESVADECFFKKNYADKGGGAIFQGKAFYCDFVSNSAHDDGGAMYRGNAYACTFTENEAAYISAEYKYYKGGAIYDGNAYNCTFIENFAGDGGAMYGGSAHNSIFKENKAQHNGGAIADGDAYYCTFTKNTMHDGYGGGMYNGNAYHCIFQKNIEGTSGHAGGAMAYSNAYNCTFKDNTGGYEAMFIGKAALCKFNGDSTDGVDIIHPAINVLNHASTYKSGEKLKFDLIVDSILLDGFNTTIEISKEGQLYTTVYALSGEEWIVDLEPGEYTAVLKLTDFPKEKSSIATITVRSTFADLNTTINGNNNSTIYLSNNDYFKFDIDSDVELINGIIINRDLTIYGNGTTINGDAITRIFKVEDNVNVKFYNINFINGKAVDGGAIYGGNAYNCFFRENTAERDGGAIYGGNATDCTFNFNAAERDGGAIYGGNATDCTFNFNAAERDGGAITQGNAYNSTFIQNHADNLGGAIHLGNATDCTFTSNTAGTGGAISQGNVYNSTFILNRADNVGGAIYLGNATDCTFTSSTAETGGAMYGGNAYNCTFKENKAHSYGGAMYRCDATDCTFAENKADRGGAIYQGNANNCTFTDNTAEKDGGAIFKGDAINCTFIGNTAHHGGAMNCEDNNRNYTAEGCTFIGNSADGGGATYFVDVFNCIFTNNTSTCDGGAVYKRTAVNCTFTGNTAERDGGAIFKGDAINCTFTGNTAERDGGAIFKGDAINCTFIGNTAHHGGAMNCEDNNRNYTAEGCTFIGNSADGGGATYFVDVFNCIFTNNTSTCDGGAVYKRTAVNCTFTGNTAERDGGAIFKGDAINCTFIGNSAKHQGGAMYEGTACLCIFNEDSTKDTKIIHPIINVLNYASTYNSGEKLKFNLTANDMVFDGFKTSIAIYKNGSLVKTASGLSGEGWIVDLGPGEYTAVLSLTDYPDEKSSNATINVSKGNTIIDISPINNAKVGQELTINYTTNSNGTVTIKVNGQKINGSKFTPTKEGIYNVSVEVAENDYYIAASNKTAFTVEKISAVVVISPIANVVVGQEVTINYTTNSNGTVTIKVNGQKISGNKFTPTKVGSYNVSVEVAENDYYIAASNKTAFTVKTNAVVVISPIANAIVGQEVTINYTTNSNGTVTIKVNGQKISGNKFTPTKVGSYNVSVEVAENDYYTAASNKTAFTVKTNAVVVISPIANAVVGQEVTINYTTNSNGTVTIKVNGQKISGNKFTPTKVGSYNVSVEVAENDYYIAASNKTAFTVEKTDAVVEISPIANVVVGQEVTINYTTNSNGTVTIKVNGQKISGNKFTPTKEGIYNVSVEVAENDYYIAASNKTAFTVEKTDAVVEISPIANVVVGQEVTINYTTNSNGTVTIKVNGQKISGNKFTPTKVGSYVVSVEVAENDYYAATSNETAFTVKTNAVVVISPIANVVVGQEVTINYTTNSNGTVTIKVDGQKISGTKFTPTKADSYNVTIEVAENDYYTAASNKTAFTAEKTDALVEISPIANVVVGQEVTINYTTNSNGTVTIKVDGQKISGTKFTPTKEGSYVVTVDVAENDYYTVASNQTKFWVEKIDNYTADINIGEDNVTVILPEDINGKLTVKVGNETFAVPVKNGVAVIPYDDLPVGENSITVTYSGDSKYAEKSFDFNVTVEPKVIITAKNLIKYYGSPDRFIVSIKDSEGRPIAGQIVYITLNGKTYDRTTDNAGMASIGVNLNSGNYTAAVKVNETELTARITVLSTVNGTNIVKIFRNATQYYVTARDSNGNYLPENTEIDFNINGVLYKRKVTGDKGLAKLNINLIPNTYIITAYNTVTGERTSNNITVLSRLTENKNITMYEKNGTKYTVRVLDETGKAVGAGENVTFNINGVLYTRTTDSNGYAALNINLMSGNYIITAMYGDLKVANNIKILPRLVASNLIKKYGTPDQFKAQLLDGKGNPVVGEKITFNINGIFYYRPTDADGFAKLNINLMSGKYIITSSYGSFVCGNTVTVNG